nr:MAG TPA: hypothetical protein [Caudoviricetes sp.]
MWKEIISLDIVVVTILIIYSSGYSVGLREGIKIGKDNSFKQVAKEALDLAKSAIETSEELKKENELLKRNRKTL